MMSDIKSRLQKLAGQTAAVPAAVAPTPVHNKPTVQAKPVAQWLDDLSQDTESVDNVDVQKSDIPDRSHRRADDTSLPTQSQPEDESVTYFAATDEFARRVAELVVAKIRDGLNHLVLP